MSQLLNSEEPHLSKSEIRRLVRGYWLVVLTVFVTGTLTMYAVLPVFFTDLYESTAELLVKVGRENAETPVTVQRGEVISQGVRVADINSEVQILSSRALVETVVDRLGPDAFKSVLVKPERWIDYPKYWLKLTFKQLKHQWSEFLITINLDKRITPREDAILRVSGGVKVEPVRDSDIFTLKVRMPTAKLSLDVANVLLEEYMQRRVAVRRGSAGLDFFASGLTQARARLDKAQARKAAVRDNYELSSPSEQRSLDLKELNSLRTEVLQNDAEIARLRKQRDLLVDSSGVMPDEVKKEQVDANNPVLQTIRERITSLEVERAKISSHYQPGSETLKKVDEEIASLEMALAREKATIVSSVTTESNPTKREFLSSIELQTAQLAGLQDRNRALAAPIAALEKQVNAREKGIDQLDATEREYRLAEQDYLAYAKRYEEARMSEELDSRRVANVSIAAAPDTPIKPVYPRKMFLMEIGLGVSLLLGLALAALLEATEDRILDERGVFGLNANYLGTVEISEPA